MRHTFSLFIVFAIGCCLTWGTWFANYAAAQDDYDIYIKDSDADDGSVPSPSPYWVSPDIWVRNDGNCMQTDNQDPFPGTLVTICVRVRNRMASGVNGITVNAYWADAAQPLFWPASWNNIGSFTIPLLTGNTAAVNSVPWNVPLNVQQFGLLARADAPNDPIGSGPDTIVPVDNVENNNNIAQRNVSALAPSSIPTLNQWGIFITALLLGGAAFIALRRRLRFQDK